MVTDDFTMRAWVTLTSAPRNNGGVAKAQDGTSTGAVRVGNNSAGFHGVRTERNECTRDPLDDS